MWSSFIESINQDNEQLAAKHGIILRAKYPYQEKMLSHEDTAKAISEKGYGKDSIEKGIREICQLLSIEKESPKNEVNLQNWLWAEFSKYTERFSDVKITDDLTSDGRELREYLGLRSINSPPAPTPEPIQRLFGASQMNDVPQWVGRDELLEELRQELVAGKKIMAIVGQGGMGKTSLAIKLSEAIGVDLEAKTLMAECEYEYIVYLRVRENDGFDSIAAELLDVVALGNGASQSPQETIDRIIAGLTKYRCLVMLDNLESLLREGTEQSIAIEIDDLLNELVFRGHRSQVIITSREFPQGLNDRRNTRIDLALVKQVIIPGISQEASIELLRQCGLTDSQADLEWIAGRVDGNTFILKQLADYAQGQPGLLRQEPEVVSNEATPIIGAQFNRQSDAGRELLRRMCVLRIGMNETHLTSLRLIESDGEVDVTKAEIRETKALLMGLKGCGLVESIYDNSACENLYTLHRLVVEVLVAAFADDLRELSCYAAKFYGSFEPPSEFRNLNDLKFVLEELYFYWQIGMQDSVVRMVVDEIIPTLWGWSYWSLCKEWCDRVLPHTEGINYRICLQTLGDICRNTGDWNGAEKYFKLSLTHAEEYGALGGIATSLGLLGDIACNRGDYDQAEALYNQSLAVRTELGDRAGMTSLWASLGFIESMRGDYDWAEALYNQSLAVRTELGDRAGMANSWASLGFIESKRGDYDRAEALYNQSLAVSTELGDRAGMATSWGCLGENELSRGNLAKAETLLLDALDRLKALQMSSAIAEVSWDLARLYRAKADSGKAQVYFDEAQLYTQLGAKADVAKIEVEWRGEA